MDIRLLGPLEVRRDGVAVAVGAPKLRALLIRLLLDAGRVVTTERLIEDLWGEAPPPQPMVSLRSYISNLRRLLQRPDDVPVIDTRARGYLLDVAPDRIDAVRFERLAQQVRTALGDDRASDAVALADEALALWHGQALADVADEPFAQPVVVKLDELRLTVVEDRFDALLEAGRHLEVVPALEAHAAGLRLRERPHRQLMVALYRSGRAPDALAVHRAFRDTLADELGLDPSPRIEALADDILRQDARLAVPSPRAGAGAVVRPRAASAPAATGLVGRDAERRHVAAAIDRLADGTGGILLVAGEPGIGKTALLDELTLHAAEVPVVWGRCHETQGAPAFWPWIEALRALADDLDDDTLRAGIQGSAGPVTQLVPEIAERTGRHVPVTGDADTARFALFDAVATFLGRVAAPRGVVVVIDDLHWADQSTLELVGFMGARAAGGRLLVAGSYRTTPADRTTELDAALSTLAREPAVVTLTLAPLSRDEVAGVVAGVTGSEPPGDLVTGLYDRAGGNPFFVRQLAQLLAETAGAEASARAAIPAGVRHVILRRAQLLPDEVQHTLDVASTVGLEFDRRVVATAAGLDAPTVLDHLDVAAAHQLVAPTDRGSGHYRFVHPLIRETLYGELRPGAAIRLHAAAADALEQHEPGAVDALAEHLWLAAELVGHDRPIRYLRAAAEEAAGVFAHEHAEQLLRRALHLIAHAPDGDPATELAVRLRLVEVLTSLRGWTAPEIEQVAGEARELAGRTGIGPALTPLWWSLWTVYMTRGDLENADALAAQLLAGAVEHDDPTSLVAGHVAVAYTRMFRGFAPAEIEAHVAAAYDAIGDADPARLGATPEHLAVAMRVTASMAATLRGDADGALRTVAEAVAVAQSLGLPFAEGYAQLFAMWTAAAANRPDIARAHGDDGLRLCSRGGFGYLAELITPAHAWACARLGEDLPEQLDRVEHAITFLEAAGHRHALPQWWILRAEMHLLAGDEAAWQAALAAAAALSRETGEDVYAPQVARIRPAEVMRVSLSDAGSPHI